jgi:hypothetical protein
MAFLSPVFLVLQTILDIILIKIFGVFGAALSWHIYAFFTGYIMNTVVIRKIVLNKINLADILRFDEYDKLIIGKALSKLPVLKKLKIASQDWNDL